MSEPSRYFQDKASGLMRGYSPAAVQGFLWEIGKELDRLRDKEEPVKKVVKK